MEIQTILEALKTRREARTAYITACEAEEAHYLRLATMDSSLSEQDVEQMETLVVATEQAEHVVTNTRLAYYDETAGTL